MSTAVTKKRMLLVTGGNVMVNSDLEALTHLVRDAWDTQHYQPDMLDAVGDYDAVMICLTNTAGRNLSKIIEAAKPGKVFVKLVDIQFHGLEGVLAKYPVTAIATLHPSIEGTDADRELRDRWMRNAHPDSRLVYCEFLAGLVHTIGPDIEAAAARVKAEPPPADVRAFYWGIRRPGIVESLNRLGFGADKRDASFGTVASQYRRVRDVSKGLSRAEKFTIDTWARYAAHAEQVLLPYEPIKSEYQITRRLLECAYLAPDTTVVDERLSEHVQRFLDPAEWHTYAKQVSEELLTILDEGVYGGVLGEYGQQVGTKHGDLLRWVIANVEFEPGWAVEFGTGDGTTARVIAERMPVMTFDCFTGLPEKWRDGFDKGMFAQPCIPNVPGSIVVNGLFEDTLSGAPLPERVALLHVDADLYSSAVTVFTRARELLQPGTVLVFDELIGYPGWQDHEHKAWTELLEDWPTLTVEPIAWAHEAVAYRVTGV